MSRYRVDTRRKLGKYLDRKIFEYGVRNIDIVIGQAAYQSKILEETFGRGCDYIVPNFHPIPSDIRHRKNDGSYTFIWVANIKDLKRPEVFINIVRRFKDNQKARFIMVGLMQEKQYEKIICEADEQIENFEYMGYRTLDETNRLIQDADVLVCTSRTEGFPNTFIQAWLRNTLVVSLGIDPDRVLTDRDMGIVVETEEELCGTIGKIVAGEGNYNREISNARDYAVRWHSLQNTEGIISMMCGGEIHADSQDSVGSQ